MRKWSVWLEKHRDLGKVLSKLTQFILQDNNFPNFDLERISLVK